VLLNEKPCFEAVYNIEKITFLKKNWVQKAFSRWMRGMGTNIISDSLSVSAKTLNWTGNFKNLKIGFSCNYF